MSRAGNTLYCLIICVILLMTIIPISFVAEETDGSPRSGSRSGGSRGLPNDIWAGFRGGSTKTGNTTATGVGRYNLLWSNNPGVVWSSSVIAYDKVYVSHGNGLTCYNMTGGTVWSFTTGCTYATPLVFNGRVYYAADNARLYCFNANASGTTLPIWTYTPSSGTSSASSPVTDGVKAYYAIKDSSALHAVWLSNGTNAWTASLGSSTVTESSPAYWNGKIYCGAGNSWFGDGPNDLFCINATNGNLIWKFTTGDDICATPAIAYGRVYISSMDTKVYCLDAEGNSSTQTTTKHWEYDVGTSQLFGSCAVGYGEVYIGDAGSVLHCLDALATGGTTTAYWSRTLSPSSLYGICSSPAITPEYIFVGAGNNYLYCINRTTGRVIWSEGYGTSTYGISSSPAVAKDLIAATSDNGRIYLIGPDITPPKVLSSVPTDAEIDVDPYQDISVKFDEDINVSSLSTTTLILKDSQDALVPGTVSSDMNIETAYFTPTSMLNKNETYKLTVTTDIVDTWDNTLDGNGNGIAEGVGVDEFEITFTTVPFYPPVIIFIPTLKPTEDVPFSLDLEPRISDPDTVKESLIITENSTYATLDGYDLNLLYPNGVTNDVINLSVSDGMFSVYKDIIVEVKSVNDPPVFSAVTPLALTEDISYILNMTDYITDVDTPYSELAIYDSSLSKYIDIDGLDINFTYPEGQTEDLLNITVFDVNDDRLSDYMLIEVSVEAVNDPPIIDELPPITVKEDIEFELSLLDFISDVDTAKDTLRIICESPYVRVDGHTLYLTYPEEVSTDILDVTVSDWELQDNTSLYIFVDPVNDLPVILEVISPKEGDVFDHDETFDLQAVVDDPDLPYGDELEFLWHDHKTGEIATTQNADDVSLPPGFHLVSFTVTDKAGGRASVNINITVNDKPAEPKPNTTDPDPKPVVNDTGSGDPSEGDDNTLIYGIIIAIVIVIIALIGVFFLMKRKKKDEAGAGEGATPSTDVHIDAQTQPLISQPMMPMQMPGQYPAMDPSLMPPDMQMQMQMQQQAYIDPSLLPYQQMPDQMQMQPTPMDDTSQMTPSFEQPQTLPEEPMTAPDSYQLSEPTTVATPQLPPGEEPVAETMPTPEAAPEAPTEPVGEIPETPLEPEVTTEPVEETPEAPAEPKEGEPKPEEE